MDDTVITIAVGVGVVILLAVVVNLARSPARPPGSSGAKSKVALGVWSETPMETRAEVLRGGALVVFGPEHQKAAVGLAKALLEEGGGVGCLAFERAAGFGFPSVPMPFCMLVFACGVPGDEPITEASLKAWMDPIVEQAFGRSGPPRSPRMSCIVPVTNRTALLQLEWKRVNAGDVEETARKLEHGYAAMGHRGHWSS
jgi:hypothetical protein